MESDELLHRQDQRQRAAEEIVSHLGLTERWAKVGEPRLVGAAAYGLMVAPDIDIEIYCDAPAVASGFAVVSDLARQRGVWKVGFSNELDGPDQGLYWQLRYRALDAEVWKVDMWLLDHDHPGPRSVDLVEAMKRALTDETRIAVLGIKEALVGEPGADSIDIYEAVLDDGVRTAAEFRAWQSEREPTGLRFWSPNAA